MLFEITPPAGNTHGPIYAESMFRALHRVVHRHERIELQMFSRQGNVGLAVDVPDSARTVFLQELQDSYPGTIVAKTKVDNVENECASQSIALCFRPDVLMARTHEEFLDLADDRQFADPVAGLLAAVRTGHSGRIECSIALVIRPAANRRIRSAERIVRRLERGFHGFTVRRWYLRLATSRHVAARLFSVLLGWLPRTPGERKEMLLTKAQDQLFECNITAVVTAPKSACERANQKLHEIAGAFGRFADRETSFVASRIARRKRARKQSFLFTPKEVATLWHPLTESGDTVSRVQRPAFREIEPPLMLTAGKERAEETILGRVQFRQQRDRFGIGMDDLRRHMIAIGKTGCGKSTFLLNAVRQQMEASRGVILVDPHGQLAEDVLSVVPKRRTNDAILFDASDQIAPVGFNPLVGPPGTDPTLIADGVLTSFKNVFGFDEGSAPRLLHIFRNCLLSLIGTPTASLTAIERLLVDANFRRSVIARVGNEAVRSFWLTEFNRWSDRDRTQYIASLQNKLGAFTTNERLRTILDAGPKGLQLRQVMDNSRLLICSLSKGTVGHDASKLLGSLLLSSLQIAAMSRASVPESERNDCVVVIDEFHSYLAEGNSTMADALAESRKYRTSYILSTQMLEQLDAATLAGVLGNCGSTLCMTVGPRDAEILAELLSSGLTPDDLIRIPKYHGYLRLLIDGTPNTFSMTTLPPPRCTVGRADIVRKVSRQRIGQRRAHTTDRTAVS